MLDTKNHSRLGSALMALFAGAALFGGCATDETQEPVGEESDLESDLGGNHGNDVILDWNEIAYNAANTAGYFGPLLFHHDRAFTMLHIAQHDALNAITRRYEQYAYTGSDRYAHPIAAAAQAARDVLVNVYPAQAPTFDAALATWLASVPNNSAKTKGIALGKASAARIISVRSTDGIANAGTYTPGTGPGKYQYVAPFNFVLHPALKTFKPFGVASPSQFRVGPPPSLTSPSYASAYNEVKAKGALNNHTRTQNETNYAAFWWELSDAGWNRIARVIADQEHLGLWRTARLFALNNMALLDGYITGWDSKFHYDFWRPTTAIHAGATDGNSATAPDAAWVSFQTVPPVQDYPSTHSVLGKASAIVIADAVRDDTVTFTFSSPTALPTNPTRTFHSFSSAASENADSRIMAGLHFRFATTAGMTLGQKVGSYIVQNRLRSIGWQSIYD